jgi:hypothetical protein
VREEGLWGVSKSTTQRRGQIGGCPVSHAALVRGGYVRAGVLYFSTTHDSSVLLSVRTVQLPASSVTTRLASRGCHDFVLELQHVGMK